MHSIFISYRRDDSQDATGRIHDQLKAQLQGCQIFKDVDSIPYGVDFRKHLSHEVGRCDVLLAVVGQRWVDARDEAGNRRLDAPTDFLRIEIEAALARGIPVIPVLVGNAAMPAEAVLPESLSPFAFLNAAPIRPDPDFHRDMVRLTNVLRNLLQDLGRAEDKGGAPGAALIVSSTSPPKAPQESHSAPALPSPHAGSDDAVPGATEGELAAVRRALDSLEVTQVGYPIGNDVAVALGIHRETSGREVFALNQVVIAPSTSDLDRYKAVRVLSLALRLPGLTMPSADILDSLVTFGVLGNHLGRRTALEAVAKAPFPPRDKWAALVGVIRLSHDDILGDIVKLLVSVTPPPERQHTGSVLLDLLGTAQEWSNVTKLCGALKTLNYRAGIPQLVSMLQTATPMNANCIAEVLVQWRVTESAPAIRDAIENARYGPDPNVGLLLRSLYALEGAPAASYIAAVLRDSAPSMQIEILHQLADVSDVMIGEAVVELARTSPDAEVCKRANDFLNRKRPA